MTQSKVIQMVLLDEPNRWFYSYELTKVSTKYGWIGTSGDRRARELYEKGLIDRRHEGRYAEYRSRETRPPQVMPEYRKEVISNLTLKI